MDTPIPNFYCNSYALVRHIVMHMVRAAAAWVMRRGLDGRGASDAGNNFYFSQKNLICSRLRKFAAILLCGIFFFNWIGYRLMNNMMEEDAARRLDSRLDRQQYSEDQLITIKVPVSRLAYYNNSPSFERASGQIEINGIPYRYVKRRIYHDSLEMRCIPNQVALTLRQSDINYLNGVNDIGCQQPSKSGSRPAGQKSFQLDPCTGIRTIRIGAPAFAARLHGNYLSAELLSFVVPTDERPPAVTA